jgi:hypothetical protein
VTESYKPFDAQMTKYVGGRRWSTATDVYGRRRTLVMAFLNSEHAEVTPYCAAKEDRSWRTIVPTASGARLTQRRHKLHVLALRGGNWRLWLVLALLLGNCRFGRNGLEGEAERFGTTFQGIETALVIFALGGMGAALDVFAAIAEYVVVEDSELPGRSNDGDSGSSASCEATIERSEGGLSAANAASRLP